MIYIFQIYNLESHQIYPKVDKNREVDKCRKSKNENKLIDIRKGRMENKK